MRLTNISEINVQVLASRLEAETPAPKIIDVRELHEVSQGTISGAIHIPLATLPVRLNELEPNEEIVVICRSGARSAQACYFLSQQGYDNTYNLSGGMMAWSRMGLNT